MDFKFLRMRSFLNHGLREGRVFMDESVTHALIQENFPFKIS